MYEKGFGRPIFASRTSISRPLSEATEMYDTEFEEDFSDVEDYSGRRSEDSVRRIATLGKTRADEPSLANRALQPHRRMMNSGHRPPTSSTSLTFSYPKSKRRKNLWKDQLDRICFEFRRILAPKMLTFISPCRRQHRLKNTEQALSKLQPNRWSLQ